jgi:hypothetical protein
VEEIGNKEDGSLKSNPIFEVKNYRQGNREIDHYIPVSGGITGIQTGKFAVVAPYVYPLGIKMNSDIGAATIYIIQQHPGDFTPAPLGPVNDPILGISGCVQWDILDSGQTIEEAFTRMNAEIKDHVRRAVDKLLKDVEGLNKKRVRMPSTDDVRNYGGRT